MPVLNQNLRSKICQLSIVRGHCPCLDFAKSTHYICQQPLFCAVIPARSLVASALLALIQQQDEMSTESTLISNPSPVIAHISDIHFGREEPAVIEGLLTSLQRLNPDLVVISGDLTQRATDEEYRKGADFLQRLAWPHIIIPGNHDLSATHLIERFTSPWDKWQQYIQPETEPVLHAKGYSLIGVNTARAAGWYFDWSRGQINQTQVKRVQDTLQVVPAQNLRIVIAHHPFWLPEQAEYRDVVSGRDKAIAGFKQANVDMILSGHIHMAYTHILQGIIVSHAGTTFSNRLLEGHPNSFNVIRGNRKQLTIEFMEWNGQQFQLVEQQTFTKTGVGWQSSP